MGAPWSSYSLWSVTKKSFSFVVLIVFFLPIMLLLLRLAPPIPELEPALAALFEELVLDELVA